jgi:PAS domain S-box-containing protein
VGEGADFRLEDVLRQMPAAVIIVDAATRRIVHANARALDMTERQLGREMPPELIDDFEIFHPDGRPYAMAEWPLVRSITSGECVVDEEYYNVLADGSRLIVCCSASPIYDDEGRLVAGVLIMNDITEQRRSQEQLTYHSRLLESVEDAVIASDERFRLTAWNEGAERMYGWRADEVLGLEVKEVLRLGLTEVERAANRLRIAEVGFSRLETVAYRRDGSPVEVESINVALRDNRGEITGYFGIHRDVSERKRAEEALRASSRRVENILESITDAFSVVDRDWRITYMNEEAARLTGRTREELIGKIGWDAFPENDNPDLTLYSEIHRAMEEGVSVQYEAYNAALGKWLAEKVYPWEDGLSFFTRDITEQKKAEERLAYHAQLLENLQDAVLATDERFIVTAWNKGAEEMFGWTADEVLGRDVHGAVPTAYSEEELSEARRQVGETGWRFVEGPNWYGKDGQPVCAESRVIALKGEDGQTTGYLCIVRDIAERRRAQEELEQRARQQAVVAQLGLQALSGGDLQSLMDDAVALVARTLDADYAKVDELLPGAEELLIRAGFGLRNGAVPGAVSEASVVIPTRRVRYGTLAVLSKQHRVFSEDEVNFLQAIANVLATAVERAEGERRLRDVREGERRRIARDLHDEALRDLAYALAETHRARASDDPDTTGHLDRLIPTLQRVGQQLRAVIYDLRLGAELDTPFPELLEALVGLHRAVAEDCDIELDVRDGLPTGPLGHTGTQVLRIVGEALTNARRHSGASHIRVGMWGSSARLWAEVADDGRGFDPETGPAAAHGGGIKGMRERATLLAGEFQIRSEVGTGTKVRLELPLRKQPEEAAEPVRVLLVEDHTAVREALAAAFEREAGVEVVGQAASLAEARRMLEEVDVAVVDLALPDGYGGDLIPALREASPQAQALILTASLDRTDIARAVESGAAGALSKTAHLDEVVDSVRRLRAGEALLPLAEVVELLRSAGRQRREEHESRQAVARLTPREREVLQALAEGLDSQGIADRLHITVRTERNHVASILTKLGTHSRLQALIVALRYGIVEIR